ncbi:redoxin domain-containing protein [Thiomicrorhabdus cannonii]|uniref:redoxin domain-containing protein n=1 Tax=Thiomicrorhabdus cannonii TaxID=2748011 RepID=UPI0015BB599D
MARTIIQLLFVVWSWSLLPVQAETRPLPLADAELNIEVVSAEAPAQARLLWLPSEYGVLSQERKVAERLAKNGIESWFSDLYEPLFLAPAPSAVDQVPTAWVQALIKEARKDGKPLWIVAANKAAQLAVRGVSAFQQESLNHLGLVLINPNLYVNTPQAGESAQYWNEVASVNLPVTIWQAELSPWRWRLAELSKQFEQAGSDVFTVLQPKVRDRFYFRADALAVEKTAAEQLAPRLQTLIGLQLPYMSADRRMAPVASAAPQKAASHRSTELQPYQGPQDRVLQLQDQQGNTVALSDYRGKVVLLNFWASWCPPCVHEMPSMARLKTRLKEAPFEILAVNLAESAAAISAFLQTHPVNFPVLLDPSGSAVKEWQVFAYPSTYLIDKQGQIRYALFGGTQWDAAEHLTLIEEALQQP